MRYFNLFTIILFAVIVSSCQANTANHQTVSSDTSSSNRFNLENRETYVLPVELDEISGHTFVQGNDDIIYCIQDEKGIVFAFDLKLNKIQRSIPFAKDADYEGITNDGRFFYILKSNGSIFSFPIADDVNEANVKEFKNLLNKGEYESLGIDTVNNQLVVICKSCKVDKKDQTTGYILDYSDLGEVSLNDSFIIDLDKARSIYPKFPKVFNPSAVTKNSITGEWYVLSSIDKLILITDADFRPISVLPFSRKMYEQPEGIDFDSKGNLYISSEKGNEGSGMLYKIN